METTNKRGNLWRHPDFLLLWGGQTVSQVGSQVTLWALPLVAVLILRATPFQMGILAFMGRFEREEVGDVAGKSLLHLQCHFGMDTLSWARLGATVTGVDFSEKAITLARSLSKETGLDASFIQSDIYQLPQVLSGTFDIVYTSYGVIGWLPDLLPWGKIIADYLKPGGCFYIVEAHPFMWTLDEKTTDFQVAYSYFSPEPIKSEEEGTYANRSAKKMHTVTYGWNHSLSEIFMSLISAGLKIEFFHEFPFCGWENFPEMIKGEDRFFRMKDPQKENLVPMTFSLKVTKPL